MVNPCWCYRIKERNPDVQQVQIRLLTKVTLLQLRKGWNFFTWKWFNFREAIREILRSFLYFMLYSLRNKFLKNCTYIFTCFFHRPLHPSILTYPQPIEDGQKDYLVWSERWAQIILFFSWFLQVRLKPERRKETRELARTELGLAWVVIGWKSVWGGSCKLLGCLRMSWSAAQLPNWKAVI